MPASTRVGEGFRRAFALALVGIIAAFLPVAQASANGIHAGAQEVFSDAVGPYDIRVVTAPVVSNMHLTVFVSPLGSADPVTRAGVQVSGRGPQGASQTVGPVLAVGSLTTWYGVNLPIEEAGEWVFTVTVESSLGEATVDFPVQVQEWGGVDWGIIGIGVFVLFMVLWFGVKTLRQGSSASPAPRQRKRGKR